MNWYLATIFRHSLHVLSVSCQLPCFFQLLSNAHCVLSSVMKDYKSSALCFQGVLRPASLNWHRYSCYFFHAVCRPLLFHSAWRDYFDCYRYWATSCFTFTCLSGTYIATKQQFLALIYSLDSISTCGITQDHSGTCKPPRSNLEEKRGQGQPSSDHLAQQPTN